MVLEISCVEINVRKLENKVVESDKSEAKPAKLETPLYLRLKQENIFHFSIHA